MSARYEYESLSDLPRWINGSLDYAHRTSLGTAIARVSAAERFGKRGTQFEGELYPRTGGKSYLALSAAVSADHDVYIPLRIFVEEYLGLPRGWEVSAGGRYLRVTGPDVKIVTGSLGKYVANYWMSVRPSVSLGGTPNSYGLSGIVRRYFSGRYDYVGVSAGRFVGVDAEVGEPTRFQRPRKLGSYQFHVDRRQPLGPAGFRLSYGAGLQSEQVAPGRRREHRTVNVGGEWFVP